MEIVLSSLTFHTYSFKTLASHICSSQCFCPYGTVGQEVFMKILKFGGKSMKICLKIVWCWKERWTLPRERPLTWPSASRWKKGLAVGVVSSLTQAHASIGARMCWCSKGTLPFSSYKSRYRGILFLSSILQSWNNKCCYFHKTATSWAKANKKLRWHNHHPLSIFQTLTSLLIYINGAVFGWAVVFNDLHIRYGFSTHLSFWSETMDSQQSQSMMADLVAHGHKTLITHTDIMKVINRSHTDKSR